MNPNGRPPPTLQQDVYQFHPHAYDALVGAEDCDGNLLPQMRCHASLSGATVVEVGAGTGRLTRLLAEAGATVFAFDRAPAMLNVAKARLAGTRTRMGIADARALPVAPGVADVFVAGWVFGHLRVWMPQDWQRQVDEALGEATRVCGPGAVMLVMETLGTGVESPAPPNAGLAEYYTHLEQAWGFARHTLATDYAFASPDAAAQCLGQFFGEAMAQKIRLRGWSRVPEFTGMWVGNTPH